MLPARTLTLGLITLVAAAAAAAAAYQRPPQPPPDPRPLQIEAARIVSTGQGITGYWRLTPSPAGHLSRGKAGACVLQSLADFTDQPPTPCSGAMFPNADCKSQLPANLVQAGYSAYCDAQQQTCWVRPPSGPRENAAMTVCNRSIDYNDTKFWNPGQHEANVTPIDPRNPPGKATHWRVLACLRTYDPATQTDPQGCPVPDWGPVHTSQ